jgi:hypothetical protein
MFSLYYSNKDESFDEIVVPTESADATRLMAGWSLKLFDYDNDGNIDLLLPEGYRNPTVPKRTEELKYLEPMLLFRNTETGLKNRSAQGGAMFSKGLAARGMALGDFDNGGSVDVLVNKNNDAPVLLRNNMGRQNHWLGVRLIGRKANINAVGAKVTDKSGDFLRHRFKVGDGSYLSSHDPRMVLELGQRTAIDWVEVKWPVPSQLVERFANLPIDRYVTLREGGGGPAAKPTGPPSSS